METIRPAGPIHVLTALALACALAPAWGAPHPMDPLTPEEFEVTREILRAAGRTNDQSLFQIVTLHEMPKDAVLAWKPGDALARSSYAVVLNGEAAFETIVDLVGRRVDSWTPLQGAQPGFMIDDLMKASEITQADPDWQAAMKKRGIESYEEIFCIPLTAGYFGREDDHESRRLLMVPCTHLGGSKNNMYARPIGGLVAVVDLHAKRLVRLIDNGVVPLPANAHNYDIESVGALRERQKPVRVDAPEGANYRIDGHQVSWQSWRFHYRLDKRAGLVVSLATYDDGGKPRRVLYQGHLSEVFVPYMDPSNEWYYRTFLDAGEYGMGLWASPLAAGIDCPRGATFLNAWLQLMGDGKAAPFENVICLFERPKAAPLWRHGESLNQTHEGRPQTDLVLRSIAQVGNYDYIVDWVFTTDGTIRVDAGATGIDITKAVASRWMTDESAADDTAYGTLVAENLVAPNHDHFLNFRFDLDVDGTANSFVPGRMTTRKLDPEKDGVPRKSLWVWDKTTVAKREADARMKINLERPAHWQVVHPSRRNGLGNPVSYVVMPGGAIAPLLTADDYPQQRADFTSYQLWVTPYAPDELYAAGRFPNQSRGGDGLPAFTAGNRSIENTDIVVWYTMGFRHVPAAEDWPVLPTKWRSVTLRPFNFFDRNPSIHLRPPED